MTEQDDPRGRDSLDDLRIVDPDALKGDPFAPKANLFSSLRGSSRGWMAGAIALGVLFLAWRFSVPASKQVTGTPAAAPASVQVTPPAAQPTAPSRQVTIAPAQTARPVTLQSENPAELKAQLVSEFRAVGVEAIGYDRLGLSGVDAKLPAPLPEAVRAMLERHRIPPPADGIVRIEIARPQ